MTSLFSKSLVYDARNRLGSKPGLHAFIVGVSDYPNLPDTLPAEPDERPETFGLTKLTSTSLSACKILDWLVRNNDRLPVELATCHLLLSPTAGEARQINRLLTGTSAGTVTGVPRADLNNFLKAAKAWRGAANVNPDGMTLFYFAGHGTQRTLDDSVLLLDDFADGHGSHLKNAVDVSNLTLGMATTPTQPFMPQTQLYFIDACRDFFAGLGKLQIQNTTEVFPLALQVGQDTRSFPVFYAAAAGTVAYAHPQNGTLFSDALLQCFDNDAGVPKPKHRGRWCVSVDSLKKALGLILPDKGQRVGVKPFFVVGGYYTDSIVCDLAGAPDVEVEIEIFPPAAHPVTTVNILDPGKVPVALDHPLKPFPYKATWKAGSYETSGTVPANHGEYRNYSYTEPLLPPFHTVQIRVVP